MGLGDIEVGFGFDFIVIKEGIEDFYIQKIYIDLLVFVRKVNKLQILLCVGCYGIFSSFKGQFYRGQCKKSFYYIVVFFLFLDLFGYCFLFYWIVFIMW